MSKDSSRYAEVAWIAADVLDLFDVSEEEAEKFLAKYANNIQERMTEAGWSALETFGAMELLPRHEKEEDDG